MSQRIARYLSVVFMLLVYFVTRLHNLMALPLFVDESVYIQRSQVIRDGSIFRAAQHSRTLHAWYTALLGPDVPVGGWTARVAIITLGLLGAAAFYGLVRGFVSHRAGIVALALWIMTPYLLFFDRMALADPALSAVAVVAVWVAWRMARTGYRWLAVMSGMSLVVVLLAKASGTSWLPLPAVALLLVADLSWRRRIVLAVWAYGTFGALWGAFTLALRWQGHSYFGVAERFVGGVNDNLVERTWHNLEQVWRYDSAYLSIPLLVVAVLGALYWLWRQPRRALFGLLALGMGGGGAIVFGHEVNSRYALNHVAWIVLLAAVGIGLLIERYPRWRPVLVLGVAVWGAVFFAPFLYRMWFEPADLPLIGNDRVEYLTHETSGFAVTDAGELLGDRDEMLPAIGLVSNCQALRLAAHPVTVRCPQLYWDQANEEQLMPLVVEEAKDGPVYVVGETLSYLDLSALPRPHTLLATFERPGGTQPVHVYRVAQGAQIPGAAAGDSVPR